MEIIDDKLKRTYYKALVERNPQFDGIFFVAIYTTGIFCHATCRARKPKFENCRFYTTAEEALLAGYRPCKICCPLSFPNEIPTEIQTLVECVEKQPEKRWKESDFEILGLNGAYARRKFKEIYGMTFVQYARARRMGLAFKEISRGSKVIEQQLATGYSSSSGFYDAFTNIMGNPKKRTEVKLFITKFIATPLGRLIAVADEEGLYLLEFENRRGLEREIERLRIRWNARLIHGNNAVLKGLEEELSQYFKGELRTFQTPLHLTGSDFQKQVWNLLQEIPMGETRSYKDLACALGDAKKVRAIGNANGANQISILIPCHRVIASDGSLGGYGGGVERKRYLLELEKAK